jgi:outer membrane immunogenic protein
MKQLLLASVGILALGIGSASAADIVRPRPAPAAAPAYVAPPFTWTGAYIGINGGYGWGNSSFSSPFASDTFDSNGGLIGGTIGYNWQAGPVVYGLEADLDWSGMSGSGSCGGLSCDVNNNWLGTARGRLGYAMGRFMPYVTGGLAVGNIETSIAGVGSSSDTKAGWTLGGGIEANLSGPWSAKLEYLYVDLGNGGGIAGSDADFTANILRAGLNYKF